MSNLDQFLDILKKKMEEKGIVEIQNPEGTAAEIVELFQGQRDENIDDEIDDMPIFSSDGNTVLTSSQIDHSYETLDIGAGE